MARGRGAKSSSAVVGYEAQLWSMADALRGSMDAAEYKHVVLGLIFLKYISDSFEELHEELERERDRGADPEDRDEYTSRNIFWVPPEARWSLIRDNARQPEIGKIVDRAMEAVERDNSVLRGVLPKDYARPALDKQRLGQLVDLISNIRVGDAESRGRDVLGRVYEYFLGQFASAEGKKGGEFYTPTSVVRLLVEMLEPYRGRVYDPCCGSGGMFVQSVRFIEAHATGNGNGGSASAQISIYGQESNYTTWRLAKMNLAIRGIDGRIEQGDTFHDDRFPDLKADFILANPPFNMKEWGGERLRDDKRWRYGVPPVRNANFAWVQHIIHHLSPNGYAGFVLANGSMSSNQSGEGEIRKNIIEADLVDCMVALPDKLFYTTQIPACLWFLARDKSGNPPAGQRIRLRDRRGEVLFIDARRMGRMVDRIHRELTDEDIAKIANTYHAWRGEPGAGEYRDIPGFCRSATIEEIRKHGHVLTPGRYVGAEVHDEEDELFEERMQRLVAQLREQQADARRLDEAIWRNLEKLGIMSEYLSLEDCKKRVVAAIVALYKYDHELLDKDVNERSITHKLAEHLQREFPYWHVDCEYNRRGDSVKRLQPSLLDEQTRTDSTEAQTVYPDIIVHRLGTMHNLVVIEVKKEGGTVATEDEAKLQAFSRSSEYAYQHGVFLKLSPWKPVLKRYDPNGGWDDWSEVLLSELKELEHDG